VAAPDILAEFEQLMATTADEAGVGSTELLMYGMDPAGAELLQRCAIPHQFSVLTLAALAPELTEEALRRYYEEFARFAIITPSPDFLMMHDQARRQLFQQWLEPDRREQLAVISGRLVEFFTEEAREGQADEKDSFERRTMFHLIGYDQDRGVDEFERLCRERRHQLRLTECESLVNLVHEYDRALTPENRMKMAYHEGKLAADRRDWDGAKVHFESMLASDFTPPVYAVKALNRLGMIYVELRQWRVAIDYYERARDLANREGDPNVFRTLLELGSAHRESDNPKEAERLLEQGIALAKKSRSFFSVAVGYNSLGILHRRLNDIPSAIKDYKRSLEHLALAGEKFQRGQVLRELGAAHAELREWTTSENYLRESLEIEQQAGDKHNQAMVLNNLARVYQGSGRPEQALEAARGAMQLFQETRDAYRGAVATRHFAKLCRASKNRVGCENALKDAIEQFRRCNEMRLVRDTERELAALTQRVGLPWWAWLLSAVLILFLTYFVLALLGIA
jgi:tetratricopeptide (TPR) repeat protein